MHSRSTVAIGLLRLLPTGILRRRLRGHVPLRSPCLSAFLFVFFVLIYYLRIELRQFLSLLLSIDIGRRAWWLLNVTARLIHAS